MEAIIMKGVMESLHRVAEMVLPRMLTQVCRDPGSPLHGCWDRNWWHYKIRDFPSIILQQGGYALWTARFLQPDFREHFSDLASASARFWNDRARLAGAFEEYYPYEQGYPPLAFGTLAMAKLCLEGAVSKEEIGDGLRVAAGQLATRFESRAANQQVAGLAAMAALRRIDASLLSQADWENQAGRTLKLQDPEGWYMEYDGPDLGYLAVTIDCLWDLVDLTGEERFKASAAKALDFIHGLVVFQNCGIGMLNSRNTDYLVPYGLTRFLRDGNEAERLQASRVLSILYANSARPDHFFTAVDDRYWCHYIGHSLFRSLEVLKDIPGDREAPRDPAPGAFFKVSGYLLQRSEGIQLIMALRKGGCFTAASGNDRISDFGWLVRQNGREYVSHWWSNDWEIGVESGAGICKGNLFGHREFSNSPWKHVALRIISRLAGYRLIGFLKSFLIFKKSSQTAPTLQRRVSIEGGGVIVEDVLRGLQSIASVERAPRASKRHVASADSWHREDAVLDSGFSVSESREESPGCLTIRTVYRSR